MCTNSHHSSVLCLDNNEFFIEFAITVKEEARVFDYLWIFPHIGIEPDVVLE